MSCFAAGWVLSFPYDSVRPISAKMEEANQKIKTNARLVKRIKPMIMPPT